MALNKQHVKQVSQNAWPCVVREAETSGAGFQAKKYPEKYNSTTADIQGLA